MSYTIAFKCEGISNPCLFSFFFFKLQHERDINKLLPNYLIDLNTCFSNFFFCVFFCEMKRLQKFNDAKTTTQFSLLFEKKKRENHNVFVNLTSPPHHYTHKGAFVAHCVVMNDVLLVVVVVVVDEGCNDEPQKLFVQHILFLPSLFLLCLSLSMSCMSKFIYLFAFDQLGSKLFALCFSRISLSASFKLCICKRCRWW